FYERVFNSTHPRQRDTVVGREFARRPAKNLLTGVRRESLKRGSEVTMARYHLSTTHLWSEQQVSIGGRTFFHRQCQICRRGFARSLDNGEWDSVHVGFLSFNFLDDEITQRWVTENCPGGPLLREANS